MNGAKYSVNRSTECSLYLWHKTFGPFFFFLFSCSCTLPDTNFSITVQIAPYDQLQTIERLVGVPETAPVRVCYYALT